MKQYNPQEYWEKRLSDHFSLTGVGHKGFNERYNEYLYRSRVESLEYLLNKYGIQIQGKNVLDIGCGTGFWVDYFHQREANSICGVDITKISIAHLKNQYPQYSFYQMNIGEENIPGEHKFDIVTSFDVFHHILDDLQFQLGIRNMSKSLRNDGYAFISDRFVQMRTPFVKHCKYRGLDEYRKELQKNNLQIKDVIPVFFLLDDAFVPITGTIVLRLFPSLLFKLDQRLKKAKLSNGNGLKLLLAYKVD